MSALASSASFRERARASRVSSGPLLVVTAALLWGTVGPAAALAGSQMSAVVMGGWRQALGGVVLVLPSLARGRHRELVVLARSRAVLAAAAATGAFQVLFVYAVAQAGPGTATALALLGCLPALPFMVAGADELQTPSAVALVVWLGVMATGAAYWCFMRGAGVHVGDCRGDAQPG